MRYFIPIGSDCSPAKILKEKGLRILAFPFDWVICPIYSIYKLLSNSFENFMDNIIVLEKDYRMLFNENDQTLELIVSNLKIYPVIDVKYDLLFPHDFNNDDENTIINVKNKYKYRINRLLKILNDSNNEIFFVYSNLTLNEWQKSKYNECNIDIENKYKDICIKSILNDINGLFINSKIIHINDINNYNL